MEEVINEKNHEKEIQEKLENLEITNFLIDSHLHFQYYSDDEIKNIVEKCYKDSEIKYFLTNSTCLDDFDRTINLSEFKLYEKISEVNKNFDQNQIIFPGIGHHPWYLENIGENWLETLENKLLELEDKKYSFFIGEIGIDGGRPKKYKII
jgi:Tat protein secretion system quality control protein TatD with DNase activity